MRGCRKFCQRRSNSNKIFLMRGERKRVSKIALTANDGPTFAGLVALRFYRGSGLVLLRNHIFFVLFQGGGPDPCPQSGSAK